MTAIVSVGFEEGPCCSLFPFLNVQPRLFAPGKTLPIVHHERQMNIYRAMQFSIETQKNSSADSGLKVKGVVFLFDRRSVIRF